MRNIKFAHLADLHIGAYREKKLTKLNLETFKLAISKIIKSQVDFVIFAGDLFNNAMPPINLVEDIILEFKKLNDLNIPIYSIGGSHDFSDSGKSFLSLLDKAGIIINVSNYQQIGKNKYSLKLITNNKLKIGICGISGKRKQLEKNIFENLEKIKLNDNYFNIFVFHTTLDDLKPSTLKYNSEITKQFLPKGFDYYAGGHIHTPIISKYCGKYISYSGTLFPNNFQELKYELPTFNLCEINSKTKELLINQIQLKTYQKQHIEININNLNSIESKNKINEQILKFEIENKIILLEIVGVIKGKISEIGINKIIYKLYEQGAFAVLKNTYKLKTFDIEKVEIENLSEDIIEIENLITEEILKQNDDTNVNNNIFNNYEYNLELIKNLLNQDFSKLEGEKNNQFEERVIEIFEKKLNKINYLNFKNNKN